MDLMIDLETTSTQNNTHILTIGAIIFNRADGKMFETFYEKIDLSSYDGFNRRFRMDPNTIVWWMKQESAAREEAFLGDNRKNIEEVLDNFITFVKKHDIDKVWSHGKEFDIKILEYHFDVFNLECPWKYWQCMDTRTLFTIGNVNFNNVTLNEEENKHNAIYDCKRQIKAVHLAYININK